MKLNEVPCMVQIDLGVSFSLPLFLKLNNISNGIIAYHSRDNSIFAVSMNYREFFDTNNWLDLNYFGIG